MAAAAPTVSTISFPLPGAVLERQAADDFVASLRSWMAVITDRVLALDASWQTVGPDATPAEQADVAASFLAHQAIGARIAEMSADGKVPVVALSQRPVFAEDGSPVSDNLADGCMLLEAIVGRAESSLQRTAATVHEAVRIRSAINGDLAAAQRLAQRLGDQVRYLSDLSTKAAAALALQGDAADPAQIQRLATQIATVRASLEAADAERQQLVSSWSGIPFRLQQMAAQEAEVRALRQRCEEKIRPLPNLAVPSVASLEAGPSLADIDSQPWPAVEPKCRTYLTKLDRVQAALDEVQRRYAEPLRERDELRGLAQAFHDKAGEAGLGEHTDLNPLYRAAADQLFSAPCDLVAARALVQRYVDAVNAITNGETAIPPRGTPDVSGAPQP